jgi:flavin reductase (DIM6/NTAB) family NADH-FMN oxidoreductase RutF
MLNWHLVAGAWLRRQKRMTQSGSNLETDFRLAMRRLAATVSIVTCLDKSDRYGMTATAVTSVCAQPPTILVCINSEARLYSKMSERGRFCINLLKASHVALSQRFGTRNFTQDRFAIGNWAESDGFLFLSDAQASLFCSIQQVIKVESHGIFVAQIDHINVAQEITPLIYQNGRYATALEMNC